jgi:hypothetical protein
MMGATKTDARADKRPLEVMLVSAVGKVEGRLTDSLCSCCPFHSMDYARLEKTTESIAECNIETYIIGMNSKCV